MVKPELAAELLDATERVALARSFYNDAVRDTRALRAVWFTRLFRLAGRAALPDYFEIVDQTVGGPGPRMAARLVLMDTTIGCCCSPVTTPHGARVWFPTGGGVEAGEELRAAAVRELFEETGLAAGRRPADRADLAQICPICVHRGQLPADGILLRRQCPFRLPGRRQRLHTLEKGSLTGHRWFSAGDLADSSDTVYPIELGERLDEATRVLMAGEVAGGVVEIN